MSMFEKICITNRSLVKGDYLTQLEKVLSSDCDMLILREKDLTEQAYLSLAEKVIARSERYGKPCILHSFVNVARKLKHPQIHLTMNQLRELDRESKEFFRVIGASTHSVAEALAAQRLGASYLTASHIFATDCKNGLAPRGLDFLRAVCHAVDLPVYALGGVHPDTIHLCMDAGAAGVCMMSEYMEMKGT